MNNMIISFLKGLLLGVLFMVPGVSAAIIAIMLNMYDKLIISLSNLRKDFKKNASYLAPIGLGALVGLILMASIIARILNGFEMFIMFFLLGSLIGSIPLMIKKANIKTLKFRHMGFIFIGISTILLLRFLPAYQGETNQLAFYILLIAGLVIAVSIILPGLCTLPVLAALGILDLTMQAISNFDIGFLFPLAIVVLIWVILTIKALEKGLTKYPTSTYLLIAGFMIGSIIQIYPEENPTGFEIPVVLVLLLISISLPLVFTKLIEENENKTLNVEVKNESKRDDEV